MRTRQIKSSNTRQKLCYFVRNQAVYSRTKLGCFRHCGQAFWSSTVLRQYNIKRFRNVGFCSRVTRLVTAEPVHWQRT